MPIVDPPEPPESDGLPHLKSGDLVNVPCIVRPMIKGTWGDDSKSPGKPYIDCDVWTLDRSGVVDEDVSVRFSWWKAVDQLSRAMGEYIACRPVRNDDNSIELASLTGPARDVAIKVAEGFAAARDAATESTPEYGIDEEPF